ncbi:MAG: hypothetical protein ABI702_06540 [Burkholderiales bacterium]
MLAYINGIKNLAESPAARKLFSSSPRDYFAQAGVTTSPRFEKSREVALARFISDAASQQAGFSGDYVSFLAKFKQYDLPTIPDASGLTAAITKLLKENIGLYNSVKGAIATAGSSNPKIAEDSLRAVVSPNALPRPGTGTAFTNIDTIVSTSVFVVTHVTVAAQVGVLAVVAIAIVAVIAGEAATASTQSFGAVSKLDNQLIDGASVATTAARMLGNKDFEIAIARDVVHREVEAIIAASEAVGLIQTTTAARAQMVQACKLAAEQSLGIAQA